MPRPGTELLEKELEELLKEYTPSRCVTCNIDLHESTTGIRKTADGCMCSDCYFASFGEEIDKHPIGVPRMHRGE